MALCHSIPGKLFCSYRLVIVLFGTDIQNAFYWWVRYRLKGIATVSYLGRREILGGKWKVLENYKGKVLVWVEQEWQLWASTQGFRHGTSWQWCELPVIAIENQGGMWFRKDPLEVRFRWRHPCVHACMMLGPWWHSPSSQPPLSYTWLWLAISGGTAKGRSEQSISVPREAAVPTWQHFLGCTHSM